jgi:hypothetical protein
MHYNGEIVGLREVLFVLCVLAVIGALSLTSVFFWLLYLLVT